jgi:hypothetical protein
MAGYNKKGTTSKAVVQLSEKVHDLVLDYQKAHEEAGGSYMAKPKIIEMWLEHTLEEFAAFLETKKAIEQ